MSLGREERRRNDKSAWLKKGDTVVEPAMPDRKPFVIYALQGGGALGAYQAGAFRAMVEHNLEPDWVTGISIGSVTASLIAGNEKNARLARVMEFWDRVASLPQPWELVPNAATRLTDFWSRMYTIGTGQRNFFRPWPVPPSFAVPGSQPAVSYYTTEPLRRTLTELVDFDYLANAQVRLSVGASKIFGGELTFFDNTKQTLRVDHILASGAFPPSFPPVQIDGDSYWDGGVIANTSIRYLEPEILEFVPPDRDILIISINLWQTYNPEPRTMDEVTWRIKQIQYSAGTRNDMQELARELRVNRSQSKFMVCLVGYHSTSEDMPYGDCDFSRSAVTRRMDKGYADMRTLFLNNPELGAQVPEKESFAVGSAARGQGAAHFF